LREGVSVGARSLVGMGSVVTKDVPANVVVIGSPARVIRENKTDNIIRLI
jgi:maltose O-acetyltransferase